ncbi:MAG: SPFH domain-containing protein [Bacteroidia bacterium]|nr:SPFH domain-containing protein [Bacteroidia bacterium]
MEKAKTLSANSGYYGLLIGFIMLLSPLINILILENPVIIGITIFIALLGIFAFAGLMVVDPNESRVLILFGKYNGTVKQNGFYWVNPFNIKKKVSLRARNFDSELIKVNDKIGNPILIGVILVWKVDETFKAAFAVDDYVNFIKIQTESAIRKLAHSYPYDNFDDEEKDISLRSGGDEINHKLEEEIRERLEIAGINVLEARISNLAYAPEIASAMLQRQQATAVVAARFKIVEGAVSMVEMALEQLSEKKIVDLDEEKKAAMVSNLMVVLCSDKSASPIVNAGTLNH